VVILVEGGSPLEAALALILFGALALLWTGQSFTRETLAAWRRTRAERKR
jgi:hypothetical protein